MRILVIGGAGGFGSTICSLLVADGHEVVAASRTLSGNVPAGASHVRLDRDKVSTDDLAPYDVVVDAAGPFQLQGLDLARAAIKARTHYLDICDYRRFVESISSLEHEALAAGVCVLSGCSSVPALSSAVVLELTDGMDKVDCVDISISASASAVFGRSVLSAMLIQAGTRMPLPDEDVTAMSSPRDIWISSPRGNYRRQVLACDAPDLTLLPGRLPGTPEVRFQAGSELRLHNFGMRCISAMVRTGILKSGLAARSLANAMRRMTTPFGSGRSGMLVEVVGRRQGHWLYRRWSLSAENGVGPSIPCLVVPTLVDRIARNELAPGARSAIGEAKVEQALSRLPVADHDGTLEDEDLYPVYRQGVSSLWDRFSPAVRQMHDVVTRSHARGVASVRRGKSLGARVICAVMGFPAETSNTPVTVDFTVKHGVETWTRKFGRSGFSSRLRARPGGVEERFGPMRFKFLLKEEAGDLLMVPDGWSLLGVPMPSILAPSGIARESQTSDGMFSFDVPIVMPLIGLVVHYKGTLSLS